MKIFLRREGGQLPTYCPQGTVDTDALLPQEAHLIDRALNPEQLSAVSGTADPVPDSYTYYLRLQQEDGSFLEFEAPETALPPEVQAAVQLLIGKIVSR